MKFEPRIINALDVIPIINKVVDAKPVAHLEYDEIVQTIRLMQLEQALTDEERTSHFAVTVYQDDQRLEGLTDDDKFLALLLDADCRGTILTSKRCAYCFGGKAYYWRKVAGRCEIIDTKSATLEGEYGGRYLGRGWVIAPYIQRLRKWMKENDILSK